MRRLLYSLMFLLMAIVAIALVMYFSFYLERLYNLNEERKEQEQIDKERIERRNQNRMAKDELKERTRKEREQNGKE